MVEIVETEENLARLLPAIDEMMTLERVEVITCLCRSQGRLSSRCGGYSWRVQKTCDFKEPGADKICGANAAWVADVHWEQADKAAVPAYQGTSWNMALCDPHYQQLLTEGLITGSAHKV